MSPTRLDPSAEIVRLCDEPRERFGTVKGIGALLASGEATPMRTGSRSMKEWVSVAPGDPAPAA